MSRPTVTVFVCTGKDCSRALKRACDGPAGKWLKRQAETAGLPCKLRIVKTECMDQCAQAGNVCFVHAERACSVAHIRAPESASRLLDSLRACLGDRRGREGAA